MSPTKEPESLSNCEDKEHFVNSQLILEDIMEEKTNNCQTSEQKQVYYSVYVPGEVQYHYPEDKESSVFSNQLEALRFLKLNKRARYKTFTNKSDAYYFAHCGDVPSVGGNKSITNGGNKSPEPQHSVSHEKSLYKAPKIQDMVKFRKAIESRDIQKVICYVENNPRYLVSSGDTPSILQEGPRYNALHVAARCNAPQVVKYILDIVSSSQLTNRIYGLSENECQNVQRSKVLLDLYLNTPDKSLNETPLHFASKTGSLVTVQLLTLYPECDRYRRNKFGYSPADIACSRAVGNAVNHKEKIIAALNENYYVPVLRSTDITMQPIIGEPITICHEDRSTLVPDSPLSPDLKVCAVAGPMSEELAVKFHRKWKSPSSPHSSQPRPSLYDFDKGLEKIGRELSSEFDVKWKEYWSFLDTFVDLKSEEGLNMLELHLKSRMENVIQSSCSGKGCVQQRFNLPSTEPECGQHSLGLPAFCLENFLKIIAKRLFSAIARNELINNEVYHLQNFLTSCYQDRRFKSIEFNKVHHRIVQLIESNLETPDERRKFVCNVSSIFESTFRLRCDGFEIAAGYDQNNVRSATYCILQLLLNLEHSNEQDLKEKDKPKNSILKCHPCKCELFLQPTKSRGKIAKKRLFTNDEIVDDVTSTFNNLSLSELTHITEKSSLSEIHIENVTLSEIESDEENFVTPPQSPNTQFLSEDSSDEEFFDSNTGLTNIYLIGDEPTKLDSSVLSAIADVPIPFQKYPYIHFWKYNCECTTNKNSWPSPDIKLGPPSRTPLKDILSPSNSRYSRD